MTNPDIRTTVKGFGIGPLEFELHTTRGYFPDSDVSLVRRDVIAGVGSAAAVFTLQPNERSLGRYASEVNAAANISVQEWETR